MHNGDARLPCNATALEQGCCMCLCLVEDNKRLYEFTKLNFLPLGSQLPPGH